MATIAIHTPSAGAAKHEQGKGVQPFYQLTLLQGDFFVNFDTLSGESMHFPVLLYTTLQNLQHILLPFCGASISRHIAVLASDVGEVFEDRSATPFRKAWNGHRFSLAIAKKPCTDT